MMEPAMIRSLEGMQGLTFIKWPDNVQVTSRIMREWGWIFAT